MFSSIRGMKIGKMSVALQFPKSERKRAVASNIT